MRIVVDGRTSTFTVVVAATVVVGAIVVVVVEVGEAAVVDVVDVVVVGAVVEVVDVVDVVDGAVVEVVVGATVVVVAGAVVVVAAVVEVTAGAVVVVWPLDVSIVTGTSTPGAPSSADEIGVYPNEPRTTATNPMTMSVVGTNRRDVGSEFMCGPFTKCDRRRRARITVKGVAPTT